MKNRCIGRALRGLACTATLAAAALLPATAFAQVAPNPAATPVADGGLAAFSQPPRGLGPQIGTNYLIRAGDEVTLTTYGEPTLSPAQPLRVLPGGVIDVPLVGEVVVGGKTTSAADAVVANKLKRYIRNPKVTVAIFTVAPVQALVLGDVKVPGKYLLQPPARLTDVIAAAGGLGPTDGDLPIARVQAADGKVTEIPLQGLLHDGQVSLNIAVQPGDEVYVPSPNLFTVHVLGAVQKPGDVELREGDNLAMAIARAGTSTAENPDLNRVTVTRLGSDGRSTTTAYNIYDVVQKGDVSKDVVMKKGDLVYVPQAPKHQNGSAFGDALLFLSRLPIL